jgi:glycosyltransferase involved in cell wall biosynthesis
MQSSRDFEWIVIDGGSTDESKELLEKNDDLITYWVSEPDAGIYNAMNKGIKASRGEYLLFLNSGDCFYDSSVVDSFYEVSSNEEIIYGNVLYENSDGTFRGQTLNKKHITICDLWIHTLPHQASFIKRSTFEKYGYYNEEIKVSADWFFYIKSIIVGGASYKYIDLTVSVMQPDGVSTKRTYGNEIKYLETIIPKRILSEIPKAVSLSEIQEVPVCAFLYKVVYRLAVFIKRIHR